MYKLMLSDLDETLLIDHHIPDFNLQAIKKAQQKGLKFVPATGRAYFMITDILQELGVDDKVGEYSICFNGGLIVENKNNCVLHFKSLCFESARILFEKAKEYEVCILIFTLDMCYIYNANDDEIQRKMIQKAPFTIMDSNNIDELKDKQIAKMLYQNTDIIYLKQIAKDLNEVIKDKVTISYSSNRYLEFNALGIDKGYGLRWLAKYLKIDIAHTIAIGDNYNDVEMIKEANLGVAVACARDDIKAIAQYVTKNDYYQGAVKEVIEKFVLEER